MSRHSKGTTKAPRQERQAHDVDRNEEALSQMIFGGMSESRKGVDDEKRVHKNDENGLVSNRSKRTLAVSVNDVESRKDSNAAWEDEDDFSLVVSANSSHRLKKLRDSREATSWRTDELENRLRRRHEKTSIKNSRAKWADLNHVDVSKADRLLANDSDGEAQSSALFSRTAHTLPPNTIEIIRLKDANADDPSGAVLRTVSFHPESDPEAPLLMTAGLDKSLRFYSVGKDDETRKIHGIHCK